PWRFGKPLPLGPVHLVWVDLAVVGALTLLMYSVDMFYVELPAITFLLGFIFCHLLAFILTRQFVFFVVLLFAAPLTSYPFMDLKIALAVLAGLYGWSLLGLQKYLKGFPWETRFWQADWGREQLTYYIKNGLIGWPHGKLNTVEHELSISLRRAAVISGLCTWWVYVFIWFFNEPNMYASFLFCGGSGCALFRILAYTYPYWQPISFLGRIFTFRWIIPRYDKIFLAPLIIISTAISPFLLFGRSCVGINGLMLATIFLVILLTFILPPSLKSWRLTGHYRLLGGQRGK
ncbi:MAG: hypothetical protein AMJ79_13650, partial [Phycisphaerae bacterium SM23_30]